MRCALALVMCRGGLHVSFTMGRVCVLICRSRLDVEAFASLSVGNKWTVPKRACRFEFLIASKSDESFGLC